MGRIAEAALFNAQVFVVATESAAQLDNKAGEEGCCGKRREAMFSPACVPGTIYFCFTVIWGQTREQEDLNTQQRKANSRRMLVENQGLPAG